MLLLVHQPRAVAGPDRHRYLDRQVVGAIPGAVLHHDGDAGGDLQLGSLVRGRHAAGELVPEPQLRVTHLPSSAIVPCLISAGCSIAVPLTIECG